MKLKLIPFGRVAFILFLALSVLDLQAQTKTQGENPKPIFVGFNFSPDYNFRALRHDATDMSGDLVINSRNDIEIAKFGYTTGLTAFFTSSKFVGFETGIQYSNKGYKTKSRDLLFELPEPNLPTKYRSVYSYQYIGIPLKARFTFGESKMRFVSTIGFMTNFLVQVRQTSFFEFADGRTEKRKQTYGSNFNRIDISPSISIGIDYRLSDKLHLTVEPTYKYGIIATMDAPVKEHLWSAGMNLGIYRPLR